ncbi:Crp/Fnr family transcriptional regulator [Microbaculum sp. FT89]|uniref:Crp/Fnr family transcriptional regulator n=1 Tax=Microbaculum sp. FT89 TaxID=3447298 RepID=UPI003F52F599
MIAHTMTTTSLGNLLARMPYFSDLDGTTLEEIARTVRQRAVVGGETILVEGRPCDGLYFVITGHVRLTRVSAEGREHVLGVLGPGATFNDVAVFDGGPNSDAAEAVGSTTVGLISKSRMLALVDRHPQVAMAALKLLSWRQRTLGGVVEDLALRDVTTRVARLLLGCAGQRTHIVERAPDACARITHQEIASMVGSVREVVQRALKELERDGAIALDRGRVRIRDQAKLERRAQVSV